jgi:hypothetical protein
MWYIYLIFFYLYGVASIVSPDMTDISGEWEPVDFNQVNNCTAGPNCGNSNTTLRTTFQLLADATWVEKVLLGSGNCTEPNVDFVEDLILVVDSFGALSVDMEAMANDSFPDSFGPQIVPQPQTVQPEPQPFVQPEPQPFVQPEPQPFVQPSINPAPEVNPAPSSLSPAELNPSPFIVNPVPQVNQVPAPATNPVPSTDLSPAELNPSPYIIIPLAPEVNPPQPSIQPVAIPSAANFSIWLHVLSKPSKFSVTIINENATIPYTAIQDGPCMAALQYWQNETLGCPCNGNWIGDGSYDVITTNTAGGREINPSTCPPNTCPEAFFINDTVKYGNVRLNVTYFQNGTIMNKTLEITKMSIIKEIGYAFGAEDIVYLFRTTKNWDGTPVNPIVPSPQSLNPSPEGEQNPAPYITTPGMNPNPVGEGSSGSTLPLATTITMIFVFLLKMYENTQ